MRQPAKKTNIGRSAHLVVPRPLVRALLRLYDYPNPRRPNRVIRGYDCPHALRTARMCAAVALKLNHPRRRVVQFQIACLLHDLGRAGLDRRLFGKIWSWAKQHGIPTRPREWRAVHPDTRYGYEMEAFLKLYAGELQKIGVPIGSWAREQIEMRLGYARRLMRRLRAVKPALAALGVRWSSWMGLVMLYYYYPEKLKGASQWVRQLAEVLVACEQFEAYSNRRRGGDYYTRERESLVEAFEYLEKLHLEGILSVVVIDAMRSLAAEGAFDAILREARGTALSRSEVGYLRNMVPRGSACRS